MAKFKTTKSSFQLMPEGTYIFKITEIDDHDYEDFGKLVIVMQTKDGQKHRENFSLLDAEGNVNEIASNILSTVYRNAVGNLNLNDNIEVDTDDMIGCYIQCDIVHTESKTKNPNTGKPYVNENAKNYKPANGFGSAKASSSSAKEESVDDELDDLD
ncbi:MAG: hypothetical protein PHC95_05100 [Parabacteroides sp.]|nr:hypothetical protein [Parabacteroides sp.]